MKRQIIQVADQFMAPPFFELLFNDLYTDSAASMAAHSGEGAKQSALLWLGRKHLPCGEVEAVAMGGPEGSRQTGKSFWVVSAWPPGH